MIPQELSNVLWAAAKLQDDAADVLNVVPAIVAQVPDKAKDMIPQHLSNVLWAAAKLKDDAPDVLERGACDCGAGPRQGQGYEATRPVQ